MIRPHKLPGRRIGFIVLVGLSLVAMAGLSRLNQGRDRVAWQGDLTAARREAAAAGRPVLIDFTADWCPACQQLGRTTWADAGVARTLAKGYVPVRVDVDAHPDLGRQYAVQYLPLLVVLEPDGRERRRSVGYLSADEVQRWLRTGEGGGQ